jgi:6-pyruvoyltetrahydropterin/6-carboxytetrahydropterin synthase
MAYQVTKKIAGFSTCFRQHRAKSHCKYLHGYALQFVLTFECDKLDDRNWVINFGGFDMIKAVLKENFDHTTIISEQDPHYEKFVMLDKAGLIQLKIYDAVGCEAFAFEVYTMIVRNLNIHSNSRIKLVSVQCIENENNSATFKP